MSDVKVTDELLDDLERSMSEEIRAMVAEVRRLRAEQPKWGNLVAQAYVDSCREEREACIEAIASLLPVDDPPAIANAQAAALNDAIEAIRARGNGPLDK